MWVRGRTKRFEEAASKEHSHSNYALKDHTHTAYASKTHEHEDYAAKTHSHSGYASSSHTHASYKNKSDFATVTKSGIMLYGVGGGAIIPYPDGFNKNNCTILSVEFCPDGGVYKGWLINYKYLMYAGLGDNNVPWGFHDISGENSDDNKLTGTIRIVLMKL